MSYVNNDICMYVLTIYQTPILPTDCQGAKDNRYGTASKNTQVNMHKYIWRYTYPHTFLIQAHADAQSLQVV